MLAGIRGLIRGITPAGPLKMEDMMETTREKYPHIILIDDWEGDTSYLEFDSLREVNEAAEKIKADEDLAYLRIRYSDGTETSWEHPERPVPGTRVQEPSQLILIDYTDHFTAYEEYDSVRSLTLTAEFMKKEESIHSFRVRYPDGKELCWLNPNWGEEE